MHKLPTPLKSVLLLVCVEGLLHKTRGEAALLEFLVILPLLLGEKLLLCALSLPLTLTGRVLEIALTEVLFSFLSLDGILLGKKTCREAKLSSDQSSYVKGSSATAVLAKEISSSV